MKIFRKERLPNGRRHVYFCDIKIASYNRTHKKRCDNFTVSGNNNTIVNCPLSCGGYIYGNNNEIIFGKNVSWVGDIYIGLPDVPINNCSVIIGDNCTANGVGIRICENGTNVKIGQDCMFSSAIIIWASDTHTITDSKGVIKNIGKYVEIGDHVWVGYGVSIAKNTTIANGCVIGMHSVVTGRNEIENCIIAGNPAKIVKKDIKWDRRRPAQYIKDTL